MSLLSSKNQQAVDKKLQKTQKNEKFLVQIQQKLPNYSPICFLVNRTK